MCALHAELTAVEAVNVAVDRLARSEFDVAGKSFVNRYNAADGNVAPLRARRHIPRAEPQINGGRLGGIDVRAAFPLLPGSLDGEIHIVAARAARECAGAADFGLIGKSVKPTCFVRHRLRRP